MSLFRKNSDEGVKVVSPPNLGWLEKKLSEKEMDYVWKCVDNRKKESYKSKLAGNITGSNELSDKSDWFFTNTLKPLCNVYADHFENIGESYPSVVKHPYYLQTWWVNYQKQHEFNPTHDHTGVYSFVIWMKIPTRYSEQRKNPICIDSNNKVVSNFSFIYTDILGKTRGQIYKMDPEMESTLLFFPSNLCHQVYPFYNCDEDRISVSGNISINTTKIL
tara:strand:+ start:42 stop:698 length:657 start_codon:yes stop_codon:yes gene_type:complete